MEKMSGEGGGENARHFMNKQDRKDSFDLRWFEVQIDGKTIGRFEELRDAIASAQITKSTRPEAALSVNDNATGRLIVEVATTPPSAISACAMRRRLPCAEPSLSELARSSSVFEEPSRHRDALESAL
jgi:hypothetical protein